MFDWFMASSSVSSFLTNASMNASINGHLSQILSDFSQNFPEIANGNRHIISPHFWQILSNICQFFHGFHIIQTFHRSQCAMHCQLCHQRHSSAAAELLGRLAEPSAPRVQRCALKRRRARRARRGGWVDPRDPRNLRSKWLDWLVKPCKA